MRTIRQEAYKIARENNIKLNDNDIIRLLSEGKQEDIVKCYHNFIIKTINACKADYMFDEAYSICLTALNEMLGKWDQSRGSFYAYVEFKLDKALRTEMANERKAQGSISNDEYLKHSSLNYEDEDGKELIDSYMDTESENACDKLIKADVNARLYNAIDSLDSRSQVVIKGFMHSVKPNVIAKDLGITVERVRQIRIDALEVLAKELNGASNLHA